MKVLQVNKFNYLRGGADKYFLDLCKLLEQAGHQVARFSMRHSNNVPSDYDRYFVSNVSFQSINLHALVKIVPRIIYSLEAKVKFAKLLDDFKPDVMHLHNIYHQISPSILPEAKKRNIPVVMHVHDFKLVCPNYKMFAKGKICQKCLGQKYYHCGLTRCFRRSFVRSWLATLEMYLHHRVWHLYEKNIDLYIAPSRFVKDKLVEWGVPADKITVINHYLDAKNYQPHYDLGQYLLYFGRLDQEKGVDKLIEAMTKVKDMSLKIVGFGPDHKALNRLIKKLDLTGKVKLVGPKYDDELKNLVQQAYAVVVPSQCFEIFGLVNLEAAALGKLVIAARIGGIPEVVKDQTTGLLFEPASVDDLAAKINWSLQHPEETGALARAARQRVVDKFAPAEHLAAITKVYQDLLKK